MTKNLPATRQDNDLHLLLQDRRVKLVIAGAGVGLLIAYGIYRRNLASIALTAAGTFAALQYARHRQRMNDLERNGDGVITVSAE